MMVSNSSAGPHGDLPEGGMDYAAMAACLGISFDTGNDSSNGTVSTNNSPPADCHMHMPSLTIPNSEAGEINILQDPKYMAIVIILYIIVILLGTLGNLLVVVTVLKTRAMWNATNIFIANLAVADILVCVFDIPLNLHYQITGQWIFGRVLCHVIPPAFAVVVYASTLTLTMIAIDRYILIVYPLKSRMSLTVAMSLVIVIVLISVAVASPIAIYAQYVVIDDDIYNIHFRYCTEVWPTTFQRRLYTIMTLICQYFIPLIIIAILYFIIFRKVKARIRKRPKPKTKKDKGCKKTKTTKMLVAVVTVFTIAWTPYQILSVLSEFAPELLRFRYFRFIDATLRVLAMSSSCINPILYGWMNDNYKNAFLSIIRRPTATPRGIHIEESMDSSHRTAVHLSPMKKLYKKLQSNGKVTNSLEKMAEEECTVQTYMQDDRSITPEPNVEGRAYSSCPPRASMV